MNPKVAGLIPAHLGSVRYPRKVLELIHGIPMIEHVRRRAAMAAGLSMVAVATGDREVAETVESLGGDVILTGGSHINGTECVAEAVTQLDVSHVLLIQGDEPLLSPEHVDAMVSAMRVRPEGSAWNATGPITSDDELNRLSVVKAVVNHESRILYCSRRNPSIHGADEQDYVRKVLGLIAYSRETLVGLPALPPSVVEQHELIEQMRLIENGIQLDSVALNESTLSVNEPADLDEVLQEIQRSQEQQDLLQSVLDGQRS